MIYFGYLVCLCGFTFCFYVMNYGLTKGKFNYFWLSIIFLFVFAFIGLELKYNNRLNDIKNYYNLSDEEIKNLDGKTIQILLDKTSEIKAEKIIQREIKERGLK